MNGLIPGGEESDKGRQTMFFTPDSDEEEPSDDKSKILKKCTVTATGNVIRMPFIV